MEKSSHSLPTRCEQYTAFDEWDKLDPLDMVGSQKSLQHHKYLVDME